MLILEKRLKKDICFEEEKKSKKRIKIRSAKTSE
jgi:hypothetical protein